MEDSIAQGIREWTQFGILIFATAFGIYRFVYKDIYLPGKRTATLAVQSSLEEFARTSTSVLIRARIHAENQSDRTVYVPALWYCVTGIRFQDQEGVLPQYLKQVEQSPTELNARYSSVNTADVVAVGTILTRLTDYYHPADQTNDEILFVVPLERYEALEMRVYFFVTKDTRGLSHPEWEVRPQGDLDAVLSLGGRRYDPEQDADHAKWAARTGAGYNWSISTLPLLRPVTGDSREPVAATAG